MLYVFNLVKYTAALREEQTKGTPRRSRSRRSTTIFDFMDTSAFRAAQAAADTVAAVDTSAFRAAQAVANVMDSPTFRAAQAAANLVNSHWTPWFGPS